MQNMSWGTLGTVRPFSNFHPERDAMELQSALEKKGSVGSAFPGGNSYYLFIIPEFLTVYSPDLDTVTLVRILTNRSNAQRQIIAKTFAEVAQKVIVLAQFNSDIQNNSWTGCKTLHVVVLHKHTTVFQMCLFIHLFADQTWFDLMVKGWSTTPLFNEGLEAGVQHPENFTLDVVLY